MIEFHCNLGYIYSCKKSGESSSAALSVFQIFIWNNLRMANVVEEHFLARPTTSKVGTELKKLENEYDSFSV